MKLEGNISILINGEYTTIEIVDSGSSTRFASIKLTPEQLSQALSRQMHTPCELEVRGLERIGKTHEHMPFVFEIPKELRSSTHAIKLHEIATSLLTDGWIADANFSSQNTFYEKDGKTFARCIVRRYV